MTTQNDDLLKVVRKQQDQIDKQKTQIGELMNHSGQLIKKWAPKPTLEAQQVKEHKIPIVVGIEATAIPTATATATPTSMTRYQTLWLAPTTNHLVG